MPAFLLDTSCIVALVSGWHEHHEVVAREVEARLDRGETLVTASAALVESYAVLTRLPAPHRLSPATAGALLERNFRSSDMAVLQQDEYWELISSAAGRGIAGGGLYDAVILECALIAGADTLLTFNERHFRSLSDGRLSVVVPGSD